MIMYKRSTIYLLLIGLILSAGILSADTDANAAYAQFHKPQRIPIIKGAAKIEKIILTLTNKERVKEGFSKLKLHPKLSNIARMHSANMLQHEFMGHQDHNGRTQEDRLHQYHPELIGGVGENVAMILEPGFEDRDFAHRLVQEWMISGGHRDNLLRANWTHIGVGVVRKGEQVYGTQFFGELFAEMQNPMPVQVSTGKDTVLRFYFYGDFPKNQLFALIYFPDKNAKHEMGDKYSVGAGQFAVKWKGSKQFNLRLKADKGVGYYRINIGRKTDKIRLYRSVLVVKSH